MKIALIGYGKMGHMIEEIALQRGHEIVCKIDVNNPEDIDSPEFCSADVAIEFTNPTAAYGNYLKAFAHNVKVVSGSTGWMKDHKADVEALMASRLSFGLPTSASVLPSSRQSTATWPKS
jgi:4-hydroxy-tetrahydrodipicolinate reductase